MDDYYFTVPLDNDCMLCLAPLTERRIAMSGQRVPDSSGYFLFEKRHTNDFSGVNIIAHVVSEEAAFRLREMFNMY